jgi:hypothetical protein
MKMSWNGMAKRKPQQGQLFHMEPLVIPGMDQGTRKKWGGRKVAKARDTCRAMFPTPCWRGCGRTITADWPEKDWHAGHVEGRAEGGADNVTNYLPECRWCNLREGGRLGAAITNGKRVAVTTDAIRERTLKWY